MNLNTSRGLLILIFVQILIFTLYSLSNQRCQQVNEKQEYSEDRVKLIGWGQVEDAVVVEVEPIEEIRMQGAELPPQKGIESILVEEIKPIEVIESISPALKVDVQKFVFTQPGMDTSILYHLNGCNGQEIWENDPTQLLYQHNSQNTIGFTQQSFYDHIYTFKMFWETQDVTDSVFLILHGGIPFIQLAKATNTPPEQINPLEAAIYHEDRERYIHDWKVQCRLYKLQCIFVDFVEFEKTKIIPGLGTFTCDSKFNQESSIRPFVEWEGPDLPIQHVVSGNAPFDGKKILTFSNYRTGSTAFVDKLNNCSGDVQLELGNDPKVKPKTQGEFERFINLPKHFKIQHTTFYRIYQYLEGWITTSSFRKSDWVFVFLERANVLNNYMAFQSLPLIHKNYRPQLHSLSLEEKRKLEIHFDPADYRQYYQQQNSYKANWLQFCHSFDVNCIAITTEEFFDDTWRLPGFAQPLHFMNCSSVFTG